MNKQGREYTTRAALKKMIADFTNRKDGFFCMKNETIAKRLTKTSKTVANSISMLKADNEIEVLYIGQTRYLKLSGKKKENLEEVKKFYSTSGTESGCQKGTKWGTPYKEYNKINKPNGSSNNNNKSVDPVNLELVKELENQLTDFRGSIEHYVCSVSNDNLLKETMKQYKKKKNNNIKSPTALFKHMVSEQVQLIAETAALKQLAKEKEVLRQKKVDNERKEFQEAVKKNELELNSWFDDYLNGTSKKVQINDLKSFVDSNNFIYLSVKEKEKLLRELNEISRLDSHNKILFKFFITQNE
ncbi:MAG TPA: hypothetical protein QF753_07255 [Victivallales bacterium]|nr:hypothetical protein [Victivallales bacterium]